MPFFTHRIDRFRGINKALDENAVDGSWASEAVNVNIIGGKLTGRVGNTRLIVDFDLAHAQNEAIERFFVFKNDGERYLIMEQFFAKLDTQDPYAPTLDFIFDNIVRPVGAYVGGGKEYIYANIDNVNCLLSEHAYHINETGEKHTAVYFINSDGKVEARKFGTGISVLNNLIADTSIIAVNKEETEIKSIVINVPFEDITDDMKERALVDGIFIFSEPIVGEVKDEDIDNAFWWFKVTSVTESSEGKTQFDVSYEGITDNIEEGQYIYIRGGCSDMPVHHLTMFYNRLFSAGIEQPRRLYWSRLPGDHRNIEDWTRTEESLDTSGGHVDIGTPSDEYISDIFNMGSQLLVFTKTNLWRLYGYSPSNYTIERVGSLEGSKISNVVDVGGVPHWLSLNGIAYYNGSRISFMDDDDNVKNILESFPDYFKNHLRHDTVHANLLNNNILFAFDYGEKEDADECILLRFDLSNGNIIKYIVPAESYDNAQHIFQVIDENQVYLFHGIRKKTRVSLVMWRDWNKQVRGWYDGSKVKSKWHGNLTDFQMPEAHKKLQTVCLRGSGRFKLSSESEVNKDVIPVEMPPDISFAKDVTPHNSQGRTFRFKFESENDFEILPYMTFLYEYGKIR